MAEYKFKLVFKHDTTNETITKTYTLDELINEMPDDILFLECDCEPVGETNVVECNCEDYLDGFKLVAKRQWTGLLDKNGVEGYAGTTVKARHQTTNEEFEDVIVWNGRRFGWGVQLEDWIIPLDTMIDCYDFEFIIDNPELIQ